MSLGDTVSLGDVALWSRRDQYGWSASPSTLRLMATVLAWLTGDVLPPEHGEETPTAGT